MSEEQEAELRRELRIVTLKAALRPFATALQLAEKSFGELSNSETLLVLVGDCREAIRALDGDQS